MAMFVMAVTLSSQNAPVYTSVISSHSPERMSELTLKNPNLSAYFASAGHSSANGWPVATFDWTNKNRSLNAHSTSWEVSATNTLMQ